MTEKQPNHLLSEHSPYLLQHAFNPVDWYPWCEIALTKARIENRLLVISIGYSACHWCHVMEHESFEDEEVAAAMNSHFVPVKVDREERPDIDQVYMDAAYATTGRGGWPLNVIALPDQRPVFAGTYFSKRDWLHILDYFAGIYDSNRDDLVQQASEVAKGMRQHRAIPPARADETPDPGMLHEIYRRWSEELDLVNGGTRGAPKFPMPANLEYLLRYGFLQGNRQLSGYMALTLDRMARGGIYDQLGGGFSRYSVDAAWHVPHFEKMLYDNAQLISLYSEAFAAEKNQKCKKVVEETIGFVNRELTSPEGLFYASLDADSEGQEGTFYVWSHEEIVKHLGEDARLFEEYFSCEPGGNWENDRNVLRISPGINALAASHDMTEEQFSAFIRIGCHRLLNARGNRERPATDDKILTCWNAMMIRGLVTAARVFGNQAWLDIAIRAAAFYRERVEQRGGKLWRNAKGGRLTIAGFLDDYAFLASAFLELYQATFDNSWLVPVRLLMAEVTEHFTAEEGLFFNLSSGEEPKLVTETLELSDNVIPASNSVIASNLLTAGYLLGDAGYILRAEMMVKAMIPAIVRSPSHHANWADLLQKIIIGVVEVNITGGACFELLQEFSGHYLPGVISSGAGLGRDAADENRRVTGKTLIYVCRDKACFAPVETVAEAIAIIND